MNRDAEVWNVPRRDFIVPAAAVLSMRFGQVPISQHRCDFTFLRTVESAKIVPMLNRYFEKMFEAAFKNFRYLNGLVNDDLVALRDRARDPKFSNEPAGQATAEMRTALRKAENAGTSTIKTVS